MSNPLILIPARMQSTRLPGKPLADIHGFPMIVQVVRRAEKAGLGPVVVACAEAEIAAAVEAAGGKAILTNPAHPSGSDRIFEALQKFDPSGRHDIILNVQGDLPTVEAETIRAVARLLETPAVDMTTAIAEIHGEADLHNPSIVKAVMELPEGARAGRALYFSRAVVPAGPGPHYHHIGLYGYRRAALEEFVNSPPSVLERREKLEQLRALALGLRIDAALVDEVPLGVDTPDDLEKARVMLKGQEPS